MPALVLVAMILPVIAIMLRRTWAWWLPGALLVVGMFITFGLIEPPEDDIGGIGALANGVLVLAALGLGALSLISFALGGIGRNKAKAAESGATAPIEPPPAARVVRG